MNLPRSRAVDESSSAVAGVRISHPDRLIYPDLGISKAIPSGSTELRQVTGPHAASAEGGLHPGGQLAALCGPQPFFRSVSVRMCLSSDKSATSRFSRAFSSSSDRSWRSSLTPKCAYFFFQM